MELTQSASVADLNLATDAPGFGLIDLDDAPAETPVDEPARDAEGRFTTEEEAPVAEEAVEEAVAEEPAPDRPKDSPEDLSRKKIPYPRFKEAVEKERAKARVLEDRLRAAEERLSRADTVDIDDAELTKLGDLLIEGKTVEYASGLKNVIANAVQTGVKIATERAIAAQTRESAEMTVENERQQAADQWAAQYPVFDPQSEQFDQSLTEEAVALRDAYESRGFSPAEALGRAVLAVTTLYGLNADQEAAAVAPPSPIAPRQPLKQKMAAAAQQPPMVPGTGAGTVDKPQTLLQKIATMTSDEFDRLSEADLDQLRNGIGR